MDAGLIAGAVAAIGAMGVGGFVLGRRKQMPAPPPTVPQLYDDAKLERDIQRFELAIEQMDPRETALLAERKAHLRYLKAMHDARGLK